MFETKNLADYTTLEIGGPTELAEISSESVLIEQVPQLYKTTPFIVIGSGSNLLVSDDGFPGKVIKNNVQGIIKEETTLIIKSGTLLQEVVDYANAHGLAGLQKLAGIPGTIGGAVYGNAGAYGQSISDNLISVQVIDPNQDLLVFTKKDCSFGYRDSIFKKNKFTILSVRLNLTFGDKKQLVQESREIIAKRSIKYPPGIKCPGSFFKNIVASSLSKEQLNKIPADKIMFGKVPAGYLLDEVGAKGDRLGSIKIADNHGNTFINLGGGTAEDFYALAKKYYQKVSDRFAINLEPEVQFINLPALNG